ncbi:hypothetical protein [Peptoniphilus catoniae]|uniref:hypothetical protein n=1 Tax=Peptoniphilus catoniae TaxID=1660341 RepID=UPI0010FD3DF5|nr:hypothetical protein [Peptoniphilus catoniae]
MKKIYLVLLFVIIFAKKSYAMEEGLVISPYKLKVNEESRPFYSYNVDGYNYYRLRDLAKALKNTSKRFDIIYEEENDLIRIIRRKNYTGQESSIYNRFATGYPAKSKIYIENRELVIPGINIGGYNYYRLRDLASIFDFSISENRFTQVLLINTAVEYRSSGNDYLRAPDYKDIESSEEFMEIFTKSFFDLYEVQMKVISDLMEKGSNSSDLTSLQNSLNSHYDYYLKLSDSRFIKSDIRIKRNFDDFVESFKIQNEEFDKVVEATRALKGEKTQDISETIYNYNNEVSKVSDKFINLVNMMREEKQGD